MRWLAPVLAVAALVLVATPLVSCASVGVSHHRDSPAEIADTFGTAEILVVAPHPDDEALMAAGVIAREHAAGKRVVVAVVTNGDLSCERDGFRREAETVAAMKRLGLREEDVFFLGYPDGHLEELGHVPLDPLPRHDRAGRCVSGNTTYASRGAGGTDVHTLLTGAPAVYTSDSLDFDLSSLIGHLRPRDIYVSHPIDEHPDHAFVYAYVRRALEPRTVATPRIHRALVHIGGCWPTAPGLPPCAEVRFAPGFDPPPLPPPLDVYRPGELFVVPDSMRIAERDANPKFLAIAEYTSQTGPLSPDLSYLFSFARAREPFFPETLAADGEAHLRRAGTSVHGVVATGGAWRSEMGVARRDLAQRAPVRCRVADAEEESSLEILRGEGQSYTVRTTAGALVLERHRAPAAVQVLRHWVLPRASGHGRHAIEIAVDVRPDDGGVAEITLRRDGDVLGVAVDPRPLLEGTSIAVSNAPPAQVACDAY